MYPLVFERMEKNTNARNSEQALTTSCSKQTDVSAGRANARENTVTKSAQKPDQDDQKSANEENKNSQDSLQEVLDCMEKIKDRTSSKNKTLQKHIATIEKIAQDRGLSPEEIDALLNIALSGKFANVINTRLLKNLIPTSVIMEDSVISAISWLCVGKCPLSTQVLFLKWLIAMFDFIDERENLNALYGFFFNFLQDEKLFPSACHILYLITRRENVKPFRVRKLLELQTRMGAEPSLLALLSLYKSFAPEMVSITLPQKMKAQFRNSTNMWEEAISRIKHRIYGTPPSSQTNLVCSNFTYSRKRKWNTELELPTCSANLSRPTKTQKSKTTDFVKLAETFPAEQLRTFPQLLQNFHCLELPSQIGSVLGNPLLLHYINCLKDDDVYQRMYYWMGQILRKGCPWYGIENQQHESEFKDLLETVIEAECFLQEGFSSCEEFLCRSLPFWDGSCCRPQVLQLVSWTSLSNFSEMKPYLFQPLTALFLTSSLYFKCSVLETLRELLLNWLNWLIMQAEIATEQNVSVLDTTLSGLVSSVAELINFVGWLSSIALHLENNSAFLMHFILDFYEIVCDVYQKYNLPLVAMPPAGVFYPALLSMDSATLDRLCYIMYRYRINLMAAKENQQAKKTMLPFKFSTKTCQEYNQFLTAMVESLWTSNVFQKDLHFQGLNIAPEVLEKTKVPEYRKSFNLVYHPALTGYAFQFLKQVQVDDEDLNFKLIQRKKWEWYTQYLYSQELKGLQLFIKNSIKRISQPSEQTTSK